MFESENQTKYLLSFFVAIGLIGGVLISKYLALSLIFFSNIFFTAYSDAKLLMYLAYAALLFLAAYFYRRSIHETRRVLTVLHMCLLILSAASLFSYVYVTRAFNLAFKTPSYFVYQGAHDTTVGPMHIHTFKPAFTWILTIVGIQNIPHYGSGLTFFRSFAELRPLYILSFFLLLFTVGVLIRYGIYVGQKRGVFFLWVYSVFSYGVVKAIVDGGPLWHEMYLNYALLCILIYFTTRKINYSKKRFITYILIGLVIIYIGLALLQGAIDTVFIAHMLKSRPIVEYALFLTGCGLIFMALNRRKYLPLILPCFVLGLYCHTYTPVVTYINYVMKTIQPNDHVTIFSIKPLDNLPLIAQESHLYSYRYTVEREQSIFSILMRYSSLFYPDVVVEGKTCDPQKTISQHTSVSIREGALRDADIASSPFLVSFHLDPVGSGHNTYTLVYQYSDCLIDVRSILVAHLQRLGFDSFVLYQ
jgi:hypothetical protein